MTTKYKLAAMLKFAQIHDWGRGAFVHRHGDALHVWDDCANQVVIFTDMQSLRDWAGY